MDSSSERTFLIVASSGRSLAASAKRAGCRARVLDLFGDADLDELEVVFTRVARGKSGGFDGDDLLKRADVLAPPSSQPPFGLVYGSGFEDRPALLARLELGRELFGNPPPVLAHSKDPFALAALIDELGLPRPEIARERPAGGGAWLVKRVGGAGGIHIRHAHEDTAHAAAPAAYYQRVVEGVPVSALVLVGGGAAMVLGLSEQWPAPGSLTQPFRFGGAAAPADLAGSLSRRLPEAAIAIAQELNLTGLNSVDFIVDNPHETFHVIEVNPRPGASLDVFERILEEPLFGLHLRACRGELPGAVVRQNLAAASAVLYAGEATAIGGDFQWPDWTADRPRPGTKIKPGEPVCTVLAEAHGGKRTTGTPTALAREIVEQRSEALRTAIRQCMQTSFARDPAAKTPRDTGGNRRGPQ